MCLIYDLIYCHENAPRRFTLLLIGIKNKLSLDNIFYV